MADIELSAILADGDLIQRSGNNLVGVSTAELGSALSATFARGHYWPRIPGAAILLQNPDVAGFTNTSLGAIGRAFVDLVVVPFDATIVAYHYSVQAAGDATATIRPALYRQTTPDASVPLELLHGGSPMAADTTGIRSVTGLSIPVTAGTVLRPAVKMETGTSVPSVHGHKTSAPVVSSGAAINTGVPFGGAGLNYRADVGAGEWPASQVVNGSLTNGPRFLVEVVPS